MPQTLSLRQSSDCTDHLRTWRDAERPFRAFTISTSTQNTSTTMEYMNWMSMAIWLRFSIHPRTSCIHPSSTLKVSWCRIPSPSTGDSASRGTVTGAGAQPHAIHAHTSGNAVCAWSHLMTSPMGDTSTAAHSAGLGSQKLTSAKSVSQWTSCGKLNHPNTLQVFLLDSRK